MRFTYRRKTEAEMRRDPLPYCLMFDGEIVAHYWNEEDAAHDCARYNAGDIIPSQLEMFARWAEQARAKRNGRI